MKEYKFKLSELFPKEAEAKTIPVLQTAAGTGLAAVSIPQILRKGKLQMLPAILGGIGVGMMGSGIMGLLTKKEYIDFVDAHAENKMGTGLFKNKTQYNSPVMRRLWAAYQAGEYTPPFKVGPYART